MQQYILAYPGISRQYIEAVPDFRYYPPRRATTAYEPHSSRVSHFTVTFKLWEKHDTLLCFFARHFCCIFNTKLSRNKAASLFNSHLDRICERCKATV